MNKKLILAFGLALLLIGTGIPAYSIACADSNSLAFSSGLTVFSPLNQTYTSNVIPLNVTFNWGAGLQCSLNYSVDGIYEGQIPLTFNNTTGFKMTYLANGLVELPLLSNGSHQLTINVQANLNDYHGANPPGAPFKPTSTNSSEYVAYWANTVSFTVNHPISSPPIDEFPSLAILPLLLIMFSIAILARHRKKPT